MNIRRLLPIIRSRPRRRSLSDTFYGIEQNFPQWYRLPPGILSRAKLHNPTCELGTYR